MLIQHEANEQAVVIPQTLQPLQQEDALQSEATQETLQSGLGLSVELAKDIQTARRGRKLQAVLFTVPFVMMAGSPFMTPGGVAPFLWTLLGWAAVIFANNLFLRRMGRRLAALEDPRTVGALLDVVRSSGQLQRKDVKEALIRLLPRLKASDAGGLSLEQRRFMYTFLTLDQKWYFAGKDLGENLNVAALQALQQVGDEEALPVVTQVAQRARSLRVRQTAQECLPFLQRRVEELQARQSLLRSSAASPLPNETLMLPAANGPETKAKELLRPIDKET